MKKIFFVSLILLAQISFAKIPNKVILEKMHLAKSYFQTKWPDVGQVIVSPDRTRPSNIWTRAVFYEGLMELYKLDPKESDMKYMMDWGNFHQWGLRDGKINTRNADNQACGQVYIDLFLMGKGDSSLIKPIKTNIDNMVYSTKADDWSWVDCLQMSMPVYARLAKMYKDNAYWEKMYDLYAFTKNKHAVNGLYDPQEALWFRDKDFVLPYKEPNGEKCFWSRGNAWVYAALVRTLEQMEANSPHREEYVTMFQNMSKALLPLQRNDGFWTVSLKDPTNFGGPELTGTALFAYGFSYGMRTGLLDKKTYTKPLESAMKGLLTCVHPSGFLGNVQGTGKEPKDGQPVTFNSVPNFEDFGLGCFLLAGTEYLKLSK
ncbi:glycoside hydrolase family 88 protein [Sandaracinomonas limnophila]|uniref:Glycoside hydrolase family 88 protein n=1 Tax=Sandaracinomonas limnophila TaxID=1862386 RepID=A0A437PXB5_9BACT|nr:glycoside hydrolase family 88 protein [Sandaracinomonas limnophila]RVU26880.1 glycoside hydrolase family 88 protein [Sandaracinomonas limnophila]